MKKVQKVALASACLYFVATPQPLYSQIWIGQIVGDMVAQEEAAKREHACMTGTPMEKKEILEARTPALKTIQAYFEAMKNGSNSRSEFFAMDKKTRWIAGDQSVGMKQIDQPIDFLATSGAELVAEPLGFVRSGIDATALGQWRVLATNGDLAGTYTVFFTRKAGQWKIRHLTLSRATEYVEPVVQYCHQPGDVLPYRLDHAKGQRTYFERRVLKAEAKLTKLDAKAVKAETKAAEKPNSASVQKKAQTARQKAEDWAMKLSERRAALANAVDEEASAVADAKANEDERRRRKAELGITT